ncbi:MAG TPA: Fe(3+) ABC transporter substrate-binding protein [Afifellaceae bacterium]|nr:Fe(3+) ABC transporter substrate-binding protein [Afifellaceae bacterium]
MLNRLRGLSGRNRLSIKLLLSVALASPAGGVLADEVVNIYSYRQPKLIAPLTDAFTKITGIETRVIFADKGLEERIKAEGLNSPADVILTVDISRLAGAAELGVTQPVSNEVIESAIPEQYRDPHGNWFGLTTRSRVVYASKERVPQTSITYEELADPKWKGRVCTRSGQHVYSIGLIASMIAHHGADAAEKWLTGVKNNLTRKPAGNDRAQVKSIFAGECDVALGNTYYMALMRTNDKEPEQKDWANSVHVIFPNSENRGSHVNISGMAMAVNAPNKANALKLMEFLTSDDAQKIYAETNHEYPVAADVDVSDMVRSFGVLKADPLPLAEIAKHRKAASELVDKVGFDDGPSS